jgi:hypothetical protein
MRDEYLLDPTCKYLPREEIFTFAMCRSYRLYDYNSHIAVDVPRLWGRHGTGNKYKYLSESA